MQPGGVGTTQRVTRLVATVAVAAGMAACGSDAATTSSTLPPVATITTLPPADTAPDDVTTTKAPATPSGHLESPAGFAFDYPEGWVETGAVIATEFAAGAECAAAQIVDFEPPQDSGEGQAGYVLHSVVQVCAQPGDGRSLDEYMRDEYPELISSFDSTELGGRPAYRLDEGLDRLAFVQNDSHRFQLMTTVVADPELEAVRIEQVDGIVATLFFA